MKKKVALLSHRGGNIGHEFMAIGVEEALKEAFGGELEIDHFEQHRPFSVYPSFHWLRLMDLTPHGSFPFVRSVLNSASFRRRYHPKTSPLGYQLAIACGGPNIVASPSPELGLMLHHLTGAFRFREVPMLDVGVGACFPHESAEKRLTSFEDRLFYAEAARNVDRTVVRDVVAEAILRELGKEPDLLPCPAVGSGRKFERAPQTLSGDKRYVLINFQRLGANTDWGQGVDPATWLRKIRGVIGQLRSRHDIVGLAHNQQEFELAATVAPDLPRILPKNQTQYAETIRNAKGAIVTRIHAGIALAGIGVPSIVVGTDTRLATINQFGLPTMFVKEADPQWLVDKLETSLENGEEEFNRLISLREHTVRSYAEIFREELGV